jgi:GNAT superfamily N-acetyltransferase
MHELLDNIAWHTLVGPQAQHAAGQGNARRYARGFSPIVAFADVSRPDFEALAPHVDVQEHFYTAGWDGAAPQGWQVEVDTTMLQMVWDGEPPAADAAPDARPLSSAEHGEQALALATLTKPGPFGPRTLELGDYFGIFDGDQLVAMAGERMFAGGLREISGVCTRPGWQGHGLARRLMEKLVRRELQRGETPFLHVMSQNENAIRLYRHMGFREHQRTAVRVLCRSA